MFTTAAQAVLDRYNARLALEEVAMRRGDSAAGFDQRDKMLLAVGEATARFLHALAVARGARRLLELGTSYGYSTLFLAQAARETGGGVVTIEHAAEKQDFARAQLAEAGLDGHVDWRCGDALTILRELEGPFDFVLLDLWKELYLPCFGLFYPKLADQAVVAADNMIFPPFHRHEARAYRAAVAAKPDLQSVLLPVGSGVELSCRWPAASDKL